jgi:hypothetical protein
MIPFSTKLNSMGVAIQFSFQKTYYIRLKFNANINELVRNEIT